MMVLSSIFTPENGISLYFAACGFDFDFHLGLFLFSHSGETLNTPRNLYSIFSRIRTESRERNVMILDSLCVLKKISPIALSNKEKQNHRIISQLPTTKTYSF